MSKIFERTENGTTAHVSIREGLAEVNTAMMEGKRDVRRMSSGSTRHSIEYKDGRRVLLVLVSEPKPEPEPAPMADVHVVSYSGGKVHSMMPGMEEHPYPLCRGGGMNQMVTKFHATDAPLTCKTCCTYAERRAKSAVK
jgi:hypothetical protein